LAKNKEVSAKDKAKLLATKVKYGRKTKEDAKSNKRQEVEK